MYTKPLVGFSKAHGILLTFVFLVLLSASLAMAQDGNQPSSDGSVDIVINNCNFNIPRVSSFGAIQGDITVEVNPEDPNTCNFNSSITGSIYQIKLNQPASALSFNRAVNARLAMVVKLIGPSGDIVFEAPLGGNGPISYDGTNGHFDTIQFVAGANGTEGTVGYIVVSLPESLIINGSFEQQAVPANNTPSVFGWEIEPGSVDWADYFIPAADGVMSIDLNGSTHGASIAQTVSVTPNTNYILRFALSGNHAGGPAEKAVQVSINDITRTYTSFKPEGATITSMTWDYHTFPFTTGPDQTEVTLTFTSQVSEGAYGPVIDDVSLTVASVPMAACTGSIGLTVEELAGTVWEFGNASGAVYSNTFTLNADGTIGGYSHPNETRWTVESGALLLLAEDGTPSTCVTSVKIVDGMQVLEGPFLLEPERNIVHILRRAMP